MPGFDKLVVVTRRTALEELIERFNTRDQARSYIEHMGGNFANYESAHDAYHKAVAFLRESIPKGLRTQWIDRSYLPTFTFGSSDIVAVLGQDGLVVNAAKYLDGQPMIALNPDVERIDGILLPFNVGQARDAIALVQSGQKVWRNVTMAQAVLNDGQRLLAVNDLFVGARTHVSARYQLRYHGLEESQSSSGLIISTGAGSTGWYRSILTGAAGIVTGRLRSAKLGKVQEEYKARKVQEDYAIPWEHRGLVFCVREPFPSKTSSTSIVYGTISPQTPLFITSQMPQNGVIFSDGVEEDRLDFNSGSVAQITLADRTLNLVVRGE
jgi:NAD kinase